MVTRRDFIMTGSVSALALMAGCADERPGPFVPLTPRATDIHAHFFNGRDIPVTGFVSQVVLRHPHEPVKETPFWNAVIELAAAILFGATSSAKDEFEALSKEAFMPDETPPETALAKDRAKVAEGLRRFSDANPTSFRVQDQAGKDQLLTQLDNLAAGRGGTRSAALRVQDRADVIADAIYSPSLLRTSGLGPPTPDQSVLQLLKWAGLLTRDRRELLEEYKRLYGRKQEGAQEIEIVSPSLVDFEYWFIHVDRRSVDIPNQLNVMSRLAYLENDLVVLNFAPFCPLRAAVQRRKGVDWLARIKAAVRSKGYVGVKLYPPMGFKPTGNTGTLGPRPGFQARGGEVDAELERLYRWCVAEDVPIKAHGNNSLGAQECSGLNAAPENWQDVIARHKDLRLNVAHFGSFDESRGLASDCKPGTVDYEDMLSALARPDSRVYADLGYWSNVTGSSTGTREIAKMKASLAANPLLGQRIMYGSDWVMIGREKGHGRYLSEVSAAVSTTGLDLDRVTSANALAYLGLDDPDSQQMRRLRAFFPAGHRFFELFGS